MQILTEKEAGFSKHQSKPSVRWCLEEYVQIDTASVLEWFENQVSDAQSKVKQIDLIKDQKVKALIEANKVNSNSNPVQNPEVKYEQPMKI